MLGLGSGLLIVDYYFDVIYTINYYNILLAAPTTDNSNLKIHVLLFEIMHLYLIIFYY